MKTAVYNFDGQTDSDLELDAQIFGVEAKPALVAQAHRVQAANARKNVANTKTRGEVSGSNRKPWKQKGTGNARAGSTRSPLWIGGGITFGPRSIQNFSLKLPVKMKKLALKTLLSEKAKAKKIIVLKDLALTKISTSQLVKNLQKLPLEEGKILAIIEAQNVNFELSAANIPYLKVIKANNLNVSDLMHYDYLLVTTEAINQIKTILGNK